MQNEVKWMNTIRRLLASEIKSLDFTRGLTVKTKTSSFKTKTIILVLETKTKVLRTTAL